MEESNVEEKDLTLLELIITGRDYRGELPKDINDFDDKGFIESD